MKTKNQKISKCVLLSMLFLGAVNFSKAQWTPGSPSGTLELDPTYNTNNNKYVQGNSATSYALQIQTPSNGYLELGPQNSTYCHILTDRTFLYMNKPLTIGSNGGANAILCSYEANDLQLQTGNYGSGGTTRVIINASTGYTGIGVTSPIARLHVNGADGNGMMALFVNGTGGTYNSTETFSASGINAVSDYNYLSQAGDCGYFWNDGKASGAKNLSSGFVLAPQANSSAGIRIAASGNVGIGQTNPSYKLDVAGTDANGVNAILENAGGTTYNQTITFFAEGLGGAGDYNPIVKAGDNGIFWTDNLGGGGFNSNSGFVIAAHSSSNAGLRIDASGKVTIGVLPTAANMPGSYNLYVSGGILTEQVRVALVGSGNWADYVFGKDYKLKPLSEVEQYINTNKHLPDVPSADEVQKNGVDVATMDATLLKKIEELTLYIIDVKKQDDAKITELQKQVDTLSHKN